MYIEIQTIILPKSTNKIAAEEKFAKFAKNHSTIHVEPTTTKQIHSVSADGGWRRALSLISTVNDTSERCACFPTYSIYYIYDGDRMGWDASE